MSLFKPCKKIKPENFSHLTDTELLLIHLDGRNDQETAARVNAFKKEYEKRDRLIGFSVQKYYKTREDIN